MKTINREDLAARLEGRERPTLVEALPEKYFQQWHLPNAVNINHDQVRQRAPELLPNKQAAIVVYCASATCQNSHMAANQLEAMGYTDVTVYQGGKEEWEKAQLPVTTA
ncbi:rhodanese-like domain-containing protein [Billgrantia gudaonensis]|uniref:Rhodanese-related sulfurtransferase n=1 Tax=Billgrantia gudaonensis TaxID=376427 RepID=A0A1G8R4T9_9GAMM|nr:rhodanese-like domain-containing protein [Halomonas gudaonensis]SDJ12004.1 Rhodanese-related sulfurtransferase [Halomonas gudaonensis]